MAKTNETAHQIADMSSPKTKHDYKSEIEKSTTTAASSSTKSKPGTLEHAKSESPNSTSLKGTADYQTSDLDSRFEMLRGAPPIIVKVILSFLKVEWHNLHIKLAKKTASLAAKMKQMKLDAMVDEINSIENRIKETQEKGLKGEEHDLHIELAKKAANLAAKIDKKLEAMVNEINSIANWIKETEEKARRLGRDFTTEPVMYQGW